MLFCEENEAKCNKITYFVLISHFDEFSNPPFAQLPIMVIWLCHLRKKVLYIALLQTVGWTLLNSSLVVST